MASKQHSVISLSNFIEYLGHFSNNGTPPEDVSLQAIHSVNPCLSHCFHDLLPNGSQTSRKACLICSIIKALGHHFANCKQRKHYCDICLQLLRLLQGHVQLCQKVPERSKTSASDICFVLLDVMLSENFDVQSHNFWVHSKKVLAEIEAVPNPESLSVVLEKEQFSDFSGHNSNSSLSGAKNATVVPEPESFNSMDDLFGDPSSKAEDIPDSSQSNSSMQCAKNSENLNDNLPTSLSQQDQSSSISEQRTFGIGARPKDKRKVSRILSGESKLCELPETREVGDFNSSYGSNKSNQSNSSTKPHDMVFGDEIVAGLPPQVKTNLQNYVSPNDTYDTQNRTYGESRVTSLPMDPSVYRGGDQFLSLETRPVGQPGVGEVVYGTREQLRLVAHYWSKLKNTVKPTTTLPQQKREEGVILSKYKKQLRILRTLYQKHCQWERLSHLGNGAAGKCHLAQDLTTEFKFCVKKLIIHKYEEQELKIWCDLKHDNIVHLFGALRQGEKIYILAEFIDGGSLTECINEQKRLNRRLSHVMALTYIRQLLEVLLYLQTKGILHEDIKSDNILIRRGSTSIAVCDFGLARYINQEKEFKGQSPSGTSTQWSPEKAASAGHGFPAEIWAAICVLVHMMSGDPPWLKRYHTAAMLHFIIYEKSPPLEDVPKCVRGDMMDFIRWGFTLEQAKRPSAQQLLSHPIFSQLGQTEPDTQFSLLTNERPPLLNSTNNDELENIVQSLQQKMEKAERNAHQAINQRSDIQMSTVATCTSGNGSSNTHISKPLISHNEAVKLPQNNGHCVGNQQIVGTDTQTKYSAHSVTVQQTYRNGSDGSDRNITPVTEVPSEVSVKFRLKDMPVGNAAIVNSSEIPKLSILDKISLYENQQDNSANQPIFSLIPPNSLASKISSEGQSDISDLNHFENQNTPQLKPSQSVPNAKALSMSMKNTKTSMSAPYQLSQYADVIPPKKNNSSSFSEIHHMNNISKMLPSRDILHTSSNESFSSGIGNIYPPSISELQRKLNSATDVRSEVSSNEFHGHDTDDESLFEHFLNDQVDPNTLIFSQPLLNRYQDTTISNGAAINLPNLPVFSKPLSEDISKASWVSTADIKTVNLDEVNSKTTATPIVTSHSNESQVYNKNPRLSPSKHKSTLHIDIKQPDHHNIVKNLTQNPFPTAPVHSENLSHGRFSTNTALPTTGSSSWLVKSSNPTISTTSRSSELDQERDKLLQEMKLDPNSLDQEEAVNETIENDIIEEQKLLTQKLQQSNINEINGNGILNFYDENKTLICSVRASPTTKDWKELFETSPILQKIQDKKISHFKIQYHQNGSLICVDYTTPIDKHQTDLTVSPTSHDDINCWCDSHLNV